jgi:histidine ammonia-lyase
MRIGEEPLAPAAVAAAARGGALDVELTTAARERIAAGRRAALAAAARGPVYGLTTGVGANRQVAVEPGAEQSHSLRLLRSHAGGMGEPLAAEVVRAALLIRLAQIATGGGGHRLEVADALAELLRADALPELRDLGGLGTGDLTVLGQLGLALADRGLEIEAGDALALMSSNAATLAVATLAWHDLRVLMLAGLGVAAVTFRALEGNREALAAPLAIARPLPGLAAVSERMRALTAGSPPPARIQDPFALRCVPQVGGALHEALAALEGVLAVEIGAATENPLVAGDEMLHHGGFHLASAALAVDALRLALVPFADLSLARLRHLMAPELTGLPPFLAADAPGSSGVLIAEYLGADALARLRADAAPAVLGSVTISRGLEEHASFAWQSALLARRATGHLRAVLGLEWIAAERALRMKAAPPDGPLAPVRALAGSFDQRLEDREIAADAELAGAALPLLAQVVLAAHGA